MRHRWSGSVSLRTADGRVPSLRANSDSVMLWERTLAPLMAHLRLRHRLNTLGIEALAAAVHLEATVFLSAPSPRLEQALRAEGLHVEVTG